MSLFYLLGFETLLILTGALFWRAIGDKHLYGFTAACALILLAETVIALLSDGALNYFRAIEIITSAASAVLLVLATLDPGRQRHALTGSALLVGYFAAILSLAFIPLHVTVPVLVFEHHRMTRLTNALGPIFMILLPVAPAAGILSFARALLSQPASPRPH